MDLYKMRLELYDALRADLGEPPIGAAESDSAGSKAAPVQPPSDIPPEPAAAD
jgi:hypothetical protein